ncbi:MAG: RNA polymerase sigma factor [Planctomycetota bacterium]
MTRTPLAPRPSLSQRLDALGGPLFGCAMARCADRDLALDATQEALVAAVRHSGEGQEWADDDLLWAWLVRVMRNKLIDELRRRRLRGLTLSSLGISPDELLPALSQDAPLPDVAAGRAEVVQLCRAALSELPPAQRELLSAVYREGRGQADIAAERGTTRKAIERLLARAREALANVLRRQLQHPEELL